MAANVRGSGRGGSSATIRANPRHPRQNIRDNPGAILLLTLLPWGGLIAFVTCNYVDIPFMDQWELVPVLQKSFEGTLTWADFWRQHNEWRYPFFFALWIPLAQATSWNLAYEVAINIAIASATFLVLSSQIRNTSRRLDRPLSNWLFPVLSALLFSITQWENWLNGYQMILFANILAVGGGLRLLSSSETGKRAFLLALSLGIVATYTAPIGMLFWPIGLGVYLLSADAPRQRPAWVGAWIGTAILAIGVYFCGYETPPGHPSLWIALSVAASPRNGAPRGHSLHSPGRLQRGERAGHRHWPFGFWGGCLRRGV